MRIITVVVVTLGLVSGGLLSGCANTGGQLRDMRGAGNGPDAFSVIAFRPLATPPTNALPPPTPGQDNRADPSPRADAIAALGGSAAARVTGGDAALVASAQRYGVSPDIRAALTADDAALRDRRRRLDLFNPLGRDRYFPTYARQALDPFSETARLRAQGVRTPTPPAAP